MLYVEGYVLIAVDLLARLHSLLMIAEK